MRKGMPTMPSLGTCFCRNTFELQLSSLCAQPQPLMTRLSVAAYLAMKWLLRLYPLLIMNRSCIGALR
jgi:hypothetical protein